MRIKPALGGPHIISWSQNIEGTGKADLTLNVGNLSLSLRGLSPHANYTDRAAAAGRRS